MLLPSFFIIDFEKYEDVPEVNMPMNTHLCYKITSASIHFIESFYAKLFLSPKGYPFCLLLDIGELLNKPEEKDENIIELLVSFTFHARYIKNDRDNPIVLFFINKPNEGIHIADMITAFKKHGYNDVETILVRNNSVIAAQKSEAKNIFNIQGDMNNLALDYIDSIRQVVSCNSSLFFFLDTPRDLIEILETIQKTELIIKSELPQTFGLLNENISLKAKEQELIVKIKALQEQLDSLDNYHNSNSSFNRYKRQITELLAYYKSEYEILPLWYKRFGHIIKVLMGKRSFRSLFDDNVKKYKD